MFVLTECILERRPPLKGIVLRQTWVYVIASWLFTLERRANGPLVVGSTTDMGALTATSSFMTLIRMLVRRKNQTDEVTRAETGNRSS